MLLVHISATRAAAHSKKQSSIEVQAQFVHPKLFHSRPGLNAIDARWHPGTVEPLQVGLPQPTTFTWLHQTHKALLRLHAGSDEHFAILTNDSMWRIYHVADLSIPEQTFELQTHLRR